MGWMGNFMPRPLYPRERDRLPIVQGIRWAPGPVWTSVDYLALTGIRSPSRQPVLSCYTHYAIPAL